MIQPVVLRLRSQGSSPSNRIAAVMYAKQMAKLLRL